MQNTHSKFCSVEGCSRSLAAKGYCMTHYQQARKGKLSQVAESSARQPTTNSTGQVASEEPKQQLGLIASGIVTKDVVATEVFRWESGDRSMPIDDLSREELLGAVRSLFETNGALRVEFEREMGEMAEAYEQKIQSLHHVLAAQVEMEIREAVRDKMEVILEAVIGEVDRRKSAADDANAVTTESKEDTNNGY